VTLVRYSAWMPLSLLAVMEDLTDRKQAAQQRRLNQLKDQFIVNMNHELRTPLTEVYGYLELLSAYQEQLDFQTQAQFLVQAKEGCQELILLINHVWAESAGIAGQGSRFYVTLPCHPQAPHDSHGAEHMLSA
jgi:signal transduction histidine kinase